MPVEHDLAEAVTQNAVSATFEAISRDAIDHMSTDLLDSLSAILGGTSAPGVGETLDFIRATSASGRGQVFGRADGLPAVFAAQANATAGHALDYDDTLDEGGGMHAGVPIHATALAIADELGGVSGHDYLAATVVGLDLSVRLALATTQDFGWHRAAAYSIFGATVAGGRLLKLNAEQMRNALGIAYSQTSGNRQCIADSALSKRLQPGFAARDAVTALRLASAGVTGASRIFEGRDGFFNLYQRGMYDRDFVLADLGKNFISTRVSLKPYPAGRGSHSLIDCALEIRARSGGEGIERIEVGAPAAAAAEGLPKYPTQVVEAQFNNPYLVALALATGRVPIGQVADPESAPEAVKSLYKKIVLVPSASDTGMTGVRRVAVTYAGGRVESAEASVASGHPTKPVSQDSLRAKAEDCNQWAGMPLSAEALARMVDLSLNIEHLENTSALTATLKTTKADPR